MWGQDVHNLELIFCGPITDGGSAAAHRRGRAILPCRAYAAFTCGATQETCRFDISAIACA